MSRKPAAAAPAPDPKSDTPIPAAADISRKDAPETTGAAQASAAAEVAPVAPTVAEQRGPQGWVVKVIGPAKGRWRAGRKFGPEEVTIPAPDLTEAQLEMLATDPELIVTVAEAED